MIDHLRQILAEAIEQLVARQSALRGQRIDLVGAERVGEIARCDRLVLAGPDPRIGFVALAALLQLLEHVAEPAADHAAGRTAREQAAKRTLQYVAKTTAKTTTETAAARSAAGRRGRRLWRRAALARGHMFDGLPGEHAEERHRHRRHSPAGLRARVRGAARALLHAVQYVE